MRKHYSIAAVYSGTIDPMVYHVTHLSEEFNDVANRSDKTAAVQYLVAHGANPRFRNSRGATVFSYAKNKEAIR